ncbi:unnamed protein product [Rotaria sp. Silwood2]|nr:unnamed protein product [Rotaria sp. Silwood2]
MFTFIPFVPWLYTSLKGSNPNLLIVEGSVEKGLLYKERVEKMGCNTSAVNKNAQRVTTPSNEPKQKAQMTSAIQEDTLITTNETSNQSQPNNKGNQHRPTIDKASVFILNDIFCSLSARVSNISVCLK